MNASDFKELPGPFNSSSKHTDSNMASLVFRPRDSDAAQYAMQQSMSIHSNPSKKDSSKKGDALMMHNSHPSFGFNNQHQQSNTKINASDRWCQMAEKCALKMLTKDVLVQLGKIDEVFQRKTV